MTIAWLAGAACVFGLVCALGHVAGGNRPTWSEHAKSCLVALAWPFFVIFLVGCWAGMALHGMAEALLRRAP
jgi:hypothetical protein